MFIPKLPINSQQPPAFVRRRAVLWHNPSCLVSAKSAFTPRQVCCFNKRLTLINVSLPTLLHLSLRNSDAGSGAAPLVAEAAIDEVSLHDDGWLGRPLALSRCAILFCYCFVVRLTRPRSHDSRHDATLKLSVGQQLPRNTCRILRCSTSPHL